MCCFCAFYSYLGECFLEPILSVRLEKDFHFDELKIGIFFSIGAVTTVIAWSVIPWLFTTKNNIMMMLIGIFGCSISIIFVGPSVILPNSLIIMAVGQVAYVSFSVLMYVYPLPEMIAILAAKFPDQDERAADISSGAINFAFTAGLLLGPLYGSFVEHALGFRTWWDLVGAQLLLLGVIFSIFIWVFYQKSHKP